MPEKIHLGNHVWFAPYAAGTSTKDIKPATGSFTKVGGCTQLTVTPTVDVRNIMEPDPGVNGITDTIAVSSSLAVTAHIIAVDKLFWQLLWQTLALSNGSGVQYNPGEGVGEVKAWVKVQQYDQTNTLKNTVDMWSSLTLGGGVTFGESPVEFDLNIQVIKSTLNTGSIATIA